MNASPRAGRNQNGQAMGRKGLQTRRRLIDATVALLETTRLRDLRVADIARTAGTSTATFYVYFPDVSDAVLAALEELTQSTPEILALADQDWSEGDPEERARRIVELYAGFWHAHRALFRMRNLAADEGDERFVKARADAIMGLLLATASAIRRAQEAGWVARDLDAMSTSGVLMAMLERFAAIQYHYHRGGAERARMIVSAAHFLAHVMGPPQAEACGGNTDAGVVEYEPAGGAKR
ncbi:MAG: TetR/AcrR family transcriptional regulator [Novosphingobium sp.]|nr:TetR/AcrR family transcriptional regulator [Novosphingobium sp.]